MSCMLSPPRSTHIVVLETLLHYTRIHTESDMLRVDSLLLAKLAACSRWLPITDGFQYDLHTYVKFDKIVCL